MNTIRYGIIGSGMMGHEHIRYINMIEGAGIDAIADPDPGMRSSAAAAVDGDVRTFESHGDMLSAGGLDAVIIASPNHTHIDVLEDVLSTNLGILVEKPLCTTLADCDRVVSLAAGRAAPVWVAMEYRYMPPVALMLEEIQGGAIGAMKMFSIREHRYPFLEKVGDWNRFNEKTDGTLVEKCCHFFDLMRLFTGSEAVRVYASGGQDVNHLDESYDGRVPDILDNAFVTVDFDNGMRASLDLCMFADGSFYQEQLTAIGDAGKIDARIPVPADFWPGADETHADVILSPRFDKNPQSRPVLVDPNLLTAGHHHGSTWYQHQRFIDILRHGGEPAVGLEDGRRAVLIGAAAEESIKTGTAIEMSH